VAISIDFATGVITVPQADLTFVSGSLYELPTETKFRADVNALMDDEIGIVFDDPIRHTTEVTIVGTTYARFIELINGYSLTIEDLLMTVRLEESNNNLFDAENGILNPSGNVTVVGQNSAGLIVVTTGSGLDAGQDAKLTSAEAKTAELWKLLGLKVGDKITITPTGVDSESGDIDIDFTGDGVSSTVMDRQP